MRRYMLTGSERPRVALGDGEEVSLVTAKSPSTCARPSLNYLTSLSPTASGIWCHCPMAPESYPASAPASNVIKW